MGVAWATTGRDAGRARACGRGLGRRRGRGARKQEEEALPSSRCRVAADLKDDSRLGSEEAAACAPREDGTPGDLAPARGRRSVGQQGRCESGERRAGSAAGAPVPGTISAEPICSALPALLSHKLADLRFLSRGASGTVSSARHADWRVQVAVKHLHIHTPLLDR
ncbi:uncharacterized protein RBU33_028658 isoform 1-T2 [Hipposideros larvatus]